MNRIIALSAFALAACGGTPLNAPEGDYVPPAQEPASFLSDLYTSPLILASGANDTINFTLPYGPATAFCGIVYFTHHAAAQTADDINGANSTGVISSLDGNGNWFVAAHIVNATDRAGVIIQCLPWKDFTRGTPVRTGYDGDTAYGTTLTTHSSEDAWTTVFAPMSFYGTENVGIHAQGMGFAVGDESGESSDINGFAVLSGYAKGDAMFHFVAVQYEGYSWSPSGCSLSLGRHSSGSCIYVPNGENANLTPVSSCDYCGVNPEVNGNGSTYTCTASTNTTQCPGTGAKFCFLADVLGGFSEAASTASVSQGVGAASLTTFSGDSANAPGAAMSCIELAF